MNRRRRVGSRRGSCGRSCRKLQACGSLKQWGRYRTDGSFLESFRKRRLPRFALIAHSQSVSRSSIADRLECRNAYASESAQFIDLSPLYKILRSTSGTEPESGRRVEQIHWHWLHVTMRSFAMILPDAGLWIERHGETLVSDPEDQPLPDIGRFC